MKILMVNKFHYIKGGSETYYFALKDKLMAEGHTVIDFSMKDEKNYPSPHEPYFVENVDYENQKGLKAKVKMAANIIYSFEAKRKFEALVKKEKPDLVHLHLFQHQISPSILDVVKKYDIPTVYTCHDLKMVCLNYKMMHHGKLCEDCKNGGYIMCLKNRCVKESLSKSLINTIEGYLHQMRKSYDCIDKIITPSEFYLKKFQEFGVAEERMVHIPNFLDASAPVLTEAYSKESYYLYFGRLSEEKGIETLIHAMKGLNCQLYIVGTGPLEEDYKSLAEKLELTNVTFLGYKSDQELSDLVGHARAVILPSEWYENGPYSAIEALQLKRPIIGADIGGIPELVHNNGALFTFGNADALRQAIISLETCSEEVYQEMEAQSYALFQRCYTWESHMAALHRVYEDACRKHKNSVSQAREKKALIVVNLAGFLTFLWNDMQSLKAMGYQVEIAMNARMADGKDAVEVETLNRMGIPYYHVDFDTKSPLAKKNLLAYGKLRKILKKKYDLVHVHTPIAGLLCRIAANKYRRKGTKVIYSTHGFTFTDRSSKKSWLIFYTMEKFASRFCDAIITINREDQKNAKRMHCKKVYRISSVGLDNSRFSNVIVDRDVYRRQFGVEKEDIMILAVGELSDRKNHQIIIKALGSMPEEVRKQFVFVIFGRAVTDSPLPENLKHMAESMGVRLVLAGHRLDIPEANACADIAVIPSVREGLGMTGLEALASGIPVIGSDVQGIRDYVKEGKTGFLCDPYDELEWASNILYLTDMDEGEKRKMKHYCKQMASRFDVAVSKAQVRKIYEEVTSE